MNMKNKGSQGDFRGSISVVVVTYNQEKFLTKSLRSVFDQTRMPDEVIVVDNGSTDATRQIIKEYRGKIFYIRNKKNLGAVRAFNQGLAAASGDYVILLSADDWFGKKILEEEGAVLDRNPNIAVVYSQAYTWHKGGKLTNAKTAGETTIIGRDEFERLLTQGDFIPLLTALIRRSVYQKLGLMDEKIKFRHDWEFWIKLAKHHKFAYLAKPLAYYRVHQSYGVASRDFMGTFEYDFRRILTKHLKGNEPQVKKIRSRACYSLYMNLSSQMIENGEAIKSLRYWLQAIFTEPLFIFRPSTFAPFFRIIKMQIMGLFGCKRI